MELSFYRKKEKNDSWFSLNLDYCFQQQISLSTTSCSTLSAQVIYMLVIKLQLQKKQGITSENTPAIS